MSPTSETGRSSSPVGYLTDRAAADALLAPAKARGVDWDQEAVGHVVRAANGYPFALQTHAAEAWMCAPPGGPIDIKAATDGVHRGRRELSQLYRRRWEEQTDRPRRYLAAVAHVSLDDRPVRTGAVAEVLGDPTGAWAGDAARLRDTGALTSTRHGWVQLGVPGWSSWIRSLQKHGPVLTYEQLARAKATASVPDLAPGNTAQVLQLPTDLPQPPPPNLER